MIYGKFKASEDGFFLLDSLATLSIIMLILLFLNPLITNWLSQRQKAKDLVEESRLVYEESMGINSKQNGHLNNGTVHFQIKDSQQRLKETGLGVRVYEGKFDYE